MRGRIVVIGNRGNTEINARLAMNKDAAILGMALFHASPVSSPVSTPRWWKGCATARSVR